MFYFFQTLIKFLNIQGIEDNAVREKLLVENLGFPLEVILIPKIPGNNKATVNCFIPILNIPWNSGNVAFVEISIPIPNLPGNSGNANGNTNPFPFP